LLGGVFQQQPTRGELRRGLLSELVQQYGGNAQQTGGAAIGAGLGIGISKLLGRDVQGAERADKIRRVQERVNSQFGDQFASDPYTAFTGTAQALFDEGLVPEANAALREAANYRPEPVETEIRFVGGTPRAEALQQRYPEVGQVKDGQEITLTLSNGEFRGVKAGDAPEEETAPSRIREYELALEKGLIDENTSLAEYNQMRAGGGRSSVTPTETQLSPYAAVINSNEDLNDKIKSFVEDAPEATLLGLNIPFTGGRDQDAVDAVSLQAQQRAAEIRSDNAELTIEQALEQAIDELSQTRGEPTPESDTSGSGAGSATPENDPYAGRVNP